MKHHAIFLDRDGTINHDYGYVKDPSQIILLPGVSKGIKKLKDEFGFKAIVISNQAGVSKGLMTSKDVDSVNDRVNELLKNEGTGIDAFFYCPFHPDLDPPEKSNCRKPSPFMIVQAAEEHEIDLSKSYMIGDKASDIESGINAGVKTILLNNETTHNEISILHNLGKKPNFTAANFNEVCDIIISDFSGGI
ncbi:MAG: HAD family hydrolase [Melioribacteraceae bacterium]